MRALLIGGSGFIGSHVVDQLLERGHEVRVFDRVPERLRPTPAGVDLRLGQLGDGAALADALVDVDCVFHMASTTVPSTSNLDPVADIEDNLINTVRLLQLMQEAEVDHILFLSSGGTVYGIPQTPMVREDHLLRPISSYGVVKVAIENYLLAAQHLHGLKPLILRPSNPYGPRQGLTGVQGVIGTFLRCVAQNKPLEIWGDGQIVRDFFYVSDLARLIVDCLESDITGVYNVGSGTGNSIREIVDVVAHVTGQQLKPVYKSGRGFDVPRIVLDANAIKQDFGWSPQVTLDEGVSRTWEWVRSNLS